MNRDGLGGPFSDDSRQQRGPLTTFFLLSSSSAVCRFAGSVFFYQTVPSNAARWGFFFRNFDSRLLLLGRLYKYKEVQSRIEDVGKRKRVKRTPFSYPERYAAHSTFNPIYHLTRTNKHEITLKVRQQMLGIGASFSLFRFKSKKGNTDRKFMRYSVEFVIIYLRLTTYCHSAVYNE